MKVLFLVQSNRNKRSVLDSLYEAIGEHCDLETRWLEDDQQADLRKYFKQNVNADRYDRIMLFLRFKKEIQQVSFLRTIPNLVFLEYDAYQNYFECKYRGKFSAHYRQIPWVRVISSGATVTRRLQEEGFDVHFVPKGYDQKMLANERRERDIELAFLGSTKNRLYWQRKAFLEQLVTEENLLITRTSSGEEYKDTLNRVRFFVSADIGMQEYMLKNFEAMACGCVLFAYDQGEEENRAMGFVDMENIVLYQDLASFKAKLARLRGDTALANKIACNGQVLVEERFTFSQLGGDVAKALQAPLRPMPTPSAWQRLRNRIGI